MNNEPMLHVKYTGEPLEDMARELDRMADRMQTIGQSHEHYLRKVSSILRDLKEKDDF